MNRYIRQTMLPEIGDAGQAKLTKARVLVLGAGGLAAPVLQYLVGAGVGKITLVDADTVSISNLHRQTLFRETDIGAAKVDAARNALKTLNTDCKITPVFATLEPANAAEFVADADIVLDCADSFATSYVLSDACLEAKTPLISASVLGLSGYVAGFCGPAPSLRAVFPDLPDRAATCATAGVLGSVVGVIGAAQAQMALAVLLRLDPSPLGQLLSFDLQNYRFSGFRFDTAKEPKIDLRFISPNNIATSDLVVELRGKSEAPQMVTTDAKRLDLNALKQTPLAPQPNQRVVFACRSGLRAWQAAQHLRTYWAGNISLIATGDTPKTEST